MLVDVAVGSNEREALQNLHTKVGIISGKRKIWAKIMYCFPIRRRGISPSVTHREGL